MDQVDIRERISYLKEMIRKKKKAVRNAPQGLLEIRKEGEHHYYLFSESGKERYLRLSDARDMKLARALAQRRYDEKILKRAEKELRLLERMRQLYQDGTVDELYDGMNAGRRELVVPVRLSDEEYADRWLTHCEQIRRTDLKKRLHRDKVQQESLRSDAGANHQDTTVKTVLFTTKNGEKVKSKSEKMIADMLLDQKKRYIYEYPVELIDHETGKHYMARPDFLVLNTRTCKAYVYEHFGKMDDPGYASDNIGKLIDYQNAGFYPGENMIVTFETRRDPLTPETVQAVIDRFLL